ncbi:YidC/Oxa1 family membrane protein insertase [Blautia wexlerae]|nr:YidC/Oxa1 family membrane protein insertase [Blautia wexlerae]
MSAVFCFTFPVGLGIYWVASATVRSVRQVVINKKMDKIQIEDLISENMKKMEKKREKAGLPPQKITNQAHQSAKNINKIEKGKAAIQMLRQEPRRLKKLTKTPRMQNLATLLQRPIW